LRWYEKNRGASNARRLKLRFAILQKYNFTCQYCGAKAPDVKLEIDHIIPKAKGGDNKIDNYIVACKECNIGKSDSILNEYQWQENLENSAFIK
jgi:5-methylcytosine-specific restriction endonuclease McrA